MTTQTTEQTQATKPSISSLYNKNYLSKRPFMLITTIYKAPRHANTQEPGWAEKYGWDVKEHIQFVDRITAKHNSTVTAIIDVLEAKVIKNGFATTSHDDVMTHYLKKYKDQVTDSISLWMDRMAATPEVRAMVASESATLNEIIASPAVEAQDVTEELAAAISEQLAEVTDVDFKEEVVTKKARKPKAAE